MYIKSISLPTNKVPTSPEDHPPSSRPTSPQDHPLSPLPTLPEDHQSSPPPTSLQVSFLCANYDGAIFDLQLEFTDGYRMKNRAYKLQDFE